MGDPGEFTVHNPALPRIHNGPWLQRRFSHQFNGRPDFVHHWIHAGEVSRPAIFNCADYSYRDCSAFLDQGQSDFEHNNAGLSDRGNQELADDPLKGTFGNGNIPGGVLDFRGAAIIFSAHENRRPHQYQLLVFQGDRQERLPWFRADAMAET